MICDSARPGTGFLHQRNTICGAVDGGFFIGGGVGVGDDSRLQQHGLQAKQAQGEEGDGLELEELDDIVSGSGFTPTRLPATALTALALAGGVFSNGHHQVAGLVEDDAVAVLVHGASPIYRQAAAYCLTSISTPPLDA